jgi:hypothetical protein
MPLHIPSNGASALLWARQLVRLLLGHRVMTTRSGVAALALLLSLPTAALAAEPPPVQGVSVQLHGHRSTGWTLQEEDPGSSQPQQVNLSDGAGLGVRLGYGFHQYVGAFASGEFDVDEEGPYTGYGAGLVFHSPRLGPARLQARAGMRWLSPGSGLFYGTVGAGAEVFLFRPLSLGLEVDASLPLADGTRFTGESHVRVEATGGPIRGIAGLTWYFDS